MKAIKGRVSDQIFRTGDHLLPQHNSEITRDLSWHLPILPISYIVQACPSSNISYQEKLYIPVNCKQSPKIDGISLACHNMLSTEHLTAASSGQASLPYSLLCEGCWPPVLSHQQASNPFWPVVETWGRGWMTKASGVGERRKGRGELRRDCHHRVAALFVPTRMQQWYMIYDI